MILTKEECKQALDIIEDGTTCFEYDGSIMQATNEFFEQISVLRDLIKEYFDPKPYESKELKVGMWVFDIKPEFKEATFFKIEEILSPDDCEYLYRDRNKKVFFDNVIRHAREFEENRFYPITKAMQVRG